MAVISLEVTGKKNRIAELMKESVRYWRTLGDIVKLRVGTLMLKFGERPIRCSNYLSFSILFDVLIACGRFSSLRKLSHAFEKSLMHCPIQLKFHLR